MSTTHLCTVPEELIDTPPDTCSSRSSFAEDGRLSRASCAKDVEEPDDAHGDLSQLVVCLFPSLHDMAQRMTRMFREHLAGQPVCNRLVATSTPACDDTLQQWRDVCKAVMDSGHIRYAIQLAAAYANNKTHTLLLECRPSFPEGVFVLYATGIRAFASADVTLFASVSFKSVSSCCLLCTPRTRLATHTRDLFHIGVFLFFRSSSPYRVFLRSCAA